MQLRLGSVLDCMWVAQQPVTRLTQRIRLGPQHAPTACRAGAWDALLTPGGALTSSTLLVGPMLEKA